jgi:putative peptide zinc metalloprotease protein
VTGAVIAAAPKLRRDLTVSRLETADGGFLIVKHPVSGRFYRFKEAERFIAEQLDGETPLDVIRERTEEQFGAALRADTLKAFVQNLDKIGLLDTGKPGDQRDPARSRRVRGNLLYLRLALLDPDRLLTRLVPRLRFCFTRRFLMVSAIPILAAFAITFANTREIAGDLPRLYQASAIVPFIALVLVVASLHEMAHGLTCKHFGGEVHELGFMMMYFQPAFYCNVSDAWLFPEKSKRLWVGFAGPYLELALWAMATIAWRLTEPDTWINYTALIVMTLSGLRSFVDFNPFVKLDGYYLLSDYLELPNLRRRSFKYVGDGIKRLLGFGHKLRVHLSQRERRIYVIYGLVATVSSLSLLSVGFVRLGSYLIDNHQPMALLLLVSYTGLRSGRRFRRLFGGRSARPDVDDDGDVVTAQPDRDSDVRGTPEAAERKKKPRRSRRREITWSAIAAAALAILFLVHVQLRIAGPFTVLPEENADVRAAVEGIVQEIRVQEGDRVKAGDVIARLADKDLRAELLKTQAQVREAAANFRKLRAGTTAESLAVARAAVSKAEDAAKFAQGKLARSKQLIEREALSPQEFEAAQEQAAAAENDLAETRSQLKVLLRGNRPEEIEAARAQLDRLEAQQHFLETQLGLVDVVSPATGVVATPARELKEMVGQFVAKGALIAKVYAVRTVTAQIVITEKEIGDVHEGQPVVLKSRAYPDLVFHGTVTTIATAADGLSSATAEAAAGKPGSAGTTGVRTFLVTTEIENKPGLLKPGMTGLAKVLGGDRRVVDLVKRRLAHTFKVEFWSWW